MLKVASKKKKSQPKQSSWRLGGYAVIALVWTYIFSSWAIESGSLVAHLLAYLGIYYALYYLKEAYRVRSRA
jgi:hypothetical protein